MAERAYPMVVRQLSEDDGGGFLAMAPDLFGCMGDGETAADAIIDLENAIVEWLAEAKRLGRDAPAPGVVGERMNEEQREKDTLLDAQQSLIEQLRSRINEIEMELQDVRSTGGHFAGLYSGWAVAASTEDKPRRSRVTN